MPYGGGQISTPAIVIGRIDAIGVRPFGGLVTYFVLDGLPVEIEPVQIFLDRALDIIIRVVNQSSVSITPTMKGYLVDPDGTEGEIAFVPKEVILPNSATEWIIPILSGVGKDGEWRLKVGFYGECAPPAELLAVLDIFWRGVTIPTIVTILDAYAAVGNTGGQIANDVVATLYYPPQHLLNFTPTGPITLGTLLPGETKVASWRLWVVTGSAVTARVEIIGVDSLTGKPISASVSFPR